MRNPVYFLQKNVGFFPLTSALIGGAIGFAVGSSGRLAVDSLTFIYDSAITVARNLPYSLQANPSQLVHYVFNSAEESLTRALYDGAEAGAVYSAGSLLLAKKIAGVLRSKNGGEKDG